MHDALLYQLDEKYSDVIEGLLEIEEESEVNLTHVEDDFNSKIINFARYIKNLEVELMGVNSAMEQMRDRSQSLQKQIKRLQDTIRYFFESTGVDEPVKCPQFKVMLKNNPPSLVIDHEELIPESYIVTKEIKSIDKTALKKDILEGFAIDGAHIEQKKRVEIK